MLTIQASRMAFAIYLRYQRDFQPEQPQILDKNINDPNVRFTFVDFIPGVIKRAGAVMSQSQVEYHSFRYVFWTCFIKKKKKFNSTNKQKISTKIHAIHKS